MTLQNNTVKTHAVTNANADRKMLQYKRTRKALVRLYRLMIAFGDVDGVEDVEDMLDVLTEMKERTEQQRREDC